MSHVTTIKIEIDDLVALEKAAKEMGASFVRNKKTYNWYGVHVGDYPLPDGITKQMLGKCDHAIKVPGINYEVGVVRKPNGKYTLAYDFYGSHGQHDGQKLLEKFGDGCGRLTQLYATHKAMDQLRKKGLTVTRKQGADGKIRLVAMGAGL